MANTQIIIATLTVTGSLLFWIIGGIFFAIIAASRFMRVNKARFSCLFSLLCVATALGASWMTVHLTLLQRPRCVMRTQHALDVLSDFPSCAGLQLAESAGLWFFLLIALGMGAMLVSWSDKENITT